MSTPELKQPQITTGAGTACKGGHQLSRERMPREDAPPQPSQRAAIRSTVGSQGWGPVRLKPNPTPQQGACPHKRGPGTIPHQNPVNTPEGQRPQPTNDSLHSFTKRTCIHFSTYLRIFNQFLNLLFVFRKDHHEKHSDERLSLLTISIINSTQFDCIKMANDSHLLTHEAVQIT